MATVPSFTVAMFSLALCAQASLYPLGMYLTDASGLNAQVLPTLAMAVVAVLGTLYLSEPLGSAAPSLSVAVGIVVCQLPVYLQLVNRKRKVSEQATPCK